LRFNLNETCPNETRSGFLCLRTSPAPAYSYGSYAGDDMLGTWVSQASLAAVLAGLALVAAIGGSRERLGAAAYLLTFVLQATTFAIGWTSPFVNICLDGALMSAFIVLSWKSPHPWPVWASAAQLLTVMIALTGFIDSNIKGWAYYTAMIIAGYASLAALIAGAIAAGRSRRRK